MQKKNKYILVLLLCGSVAANAQLSTNATGMFVKAGTLLSIDSLSLIPTADVTIANNQLTISYIPIVGSPTGSIARVYQWQNPLTLEGAIGIRYANAELNGNTPASLETVYSPDMSSGFHQGTGTTSTTNYVATNFGSSTVQRITAKNLTSVLPLTLLAFTATAYQQTQALLEWRTAQEVNVAHITIERSNDAISFEALGKVAARNVLDEQYYTFIDATPLSGNNYYRLVFTDIDGSYEFSPVRLVAFRNLSVLKVYPNPASSVVRIEGIPAGATVLITDMSGKVLYKKQTDASSTEVPVQNLPTGTYVLQLEQNGQVTPAGKILIAR